MTEGDSAAYYELLEKMKKERYSTHKLDLSKNKGSLEVLSSH